MNDEIRTEQAVAAHQIAGRTVEIGAGSSPVPGVAVTVDHRVGGDGPGCEEGKQTRPDVCADATPGHTVEVSPGIPRWSFMVTSQPQED